MAVQETIKAGQIWFSAACFVVIEIFHNPTNISALMLAVWGFWLAYWQPFPDTTAYRAMSEIASEQVWGWGLGLLGLSRVVLRSQRHRLRRYKKHTRFIGAVLQAGICTAWFFLLILFFLSGSRTTALPAFFIMWLVSVAGFLRVTGWADYLEQRGGCG